jgi:hypothetical protein
MTFFEFSLYHLEARTQTETYMETKQKKEVSINDNSSSQKDMYWEKYFSFSMS